MQLDPFQKQVLETEGNICLRSGRQVGKSTIISIKAAQFAVKNRKTSIMVIASVERQAYLLFEKILAYLNQNYPKMIKMGKDRPTKHKIILTNGSMIQSLPTGMTGQGIRGFTINLLIADEAAFIPEAVWTAVTPMLAITRGVIWLLSTPHGKEGYYYNCFSRPDFTSFHVSSEDCPRKDQIFLDSEKKRMTKVQYAQEYLGEFVDELMQFFSTALIKRCMLGEEIKPSHHNKFLGVDVARMGGDETVLVSVERRNREKLIMYEIDVSSKTLLTETIQRILASDKKYNYKKIFIDDGGLGVGVVDPLLEEPQTRNKVVSINNSSRAYNRDDKRKKLLKEDLYTNLLWLMEHHKIQLIASPEVLLSLKSIQVEYIEGKMKIYGNYSHIAEALIRASWCMRDKTLNLWVR